MIPDSDLSRASPWKTHSHFSLFFFSRHDEIILSEILFFDSCNFSIRSEPTKSTKISPRPLGEVRYAWPTDVECFYQSGKGAKRLRVNEAFGEGFPQWLLWTYSGLWSESGLIVEATVFRDSV